MRVKGAGLHPCTQWDPTLSQPALCVPIDLTAGSLAFQPPNNTDNARRPGLCSECAALFKLTLFTVTFLGAIFSLRFQSTLCSVFDIS